MDIAQHITKHNLLHENENVRIPAIWAEATFSEFYFEASYPTEFAYPDSGGNLRTSESILLTGFPADPFNDIKNDPSRMQKLRQWLEQLHSNEIYDITRPETVGRETGVIPLKYTDTERDVPLTLAIQVRVSRTRRGEISTQPPTLQEVIKFIHAAADDLS